MGSELIEAVTVSKSKSSSSSSAGKIFPPGFRFHPTDEELVLYYLKRKICRRSLKLDIIGEVDVYKWHPEELPGISKLKTGDRQWFFFSPRNRKYPNGGRSSRATMNGYWKATGKDRIIKRESCSVGIKKTLVYYQGRAPSGTRTDWVMHEYTMDEEELKRCSFAQEHYVLYKIFKKSGPGPKNGEQYGAVFVEEEWSDDDCPDASALLVQKNNPIPVNDFGKVQEEEENQNLFSSDVIEFLNKIVDKTEILPPLPQILETSEKNLIEGSSSKVEKGPTPSGIELQPVNEDFLEMNDLNGPEPVISSLERFESEGLQFPEFDSLSNFELYHDSMRFEDIGMFGTPQFEVQGGNMGNELPISYDLWDHGQEDGSVMTIQTIHQAVSESSSGVVIEENLGKSEGHLNECRESNTDDGSDSWFSAALYAFVESIPTTPASALESGALVNRALKRMSSFSRGGSVDARSASKRLEKPKASRGIVFYSVLGVLFAVLWIFVGSYVELLGSCLWW